MLTFDKAILKILSSFLLNR